MLALCVSYVEEVHLGFPLCLRAFSVTPMLVHLSMTRHAFKACPSTLQGSCRALNAARQCHCKTPFRSLQQSGGWGVCKRQRWEWHFNVARAGRALNRDGALGAGTSICLLGGGELDALTASAFGRSRIRCMAVLASCQHSDARAGAVAFEARRCAHSTHKLLGRSAFVRVRRTRCLQVRPPLGS